MDANQRCKCAATEIAEILVRYQVEFRFDDEDMEMCIEPAEELVEIEGLLVQ